MCNTAKLYNLHKDSFDAEHGDKPLYYTCLQKLGNMVKQQQQQQQQKTCKIYENEM